MTSFCSRSSFRHGLPTAIAGAIANGEAGSKAEPQDAASKSRLQGCHPCGVFFQSCCRVPSPFRARPARGSLFFACPKKSNQKKCTPDAALAAARRVREGMPGSVDCTSLSRQRNRRDPSHRPCGRFRHALATANGDPSGKPEQRRQRTRWPLRLALGR